MSKTPKTHTTMRGVQINMEEMRRANEESVAVTGRGASLRMNARGDLLAKGGRVDRKREDIDAQYNTNLQGNAKRVDIRSVEADSFETPQQVVERLTKVNAQPTPAETPAKKNTLEDVFETPTTVEPAKDVIPRDRARKLIEKDD